MSATEHLLPAHVRRSLTDLLGALAGTDVCELDLTDGDVHLHLQRDIRASGVGDLATVTTMANSGSSTLSPLVVDSATFALAQRLLRSTLVGVFTRMREGDSAPLAEEGQWLKVGQPYGMVDGLHAQVLTAEDEGHLLRFLVADGDPVEYGQPLAEIE